MTTPLPAPDTPFDPAWSQVRRVLAVRLDNLGDVLMTTPALAAIKDSLPGVHLTLLASHSGALLHRHLPMVDEVIAYEAGWVKNDRAATPTDDLALVERLAAGRYDAAVIFTVCTQNPLPSAMLCRLAGIPLRAAHCRENPYALLTHWIREPDADIGTARHEAQRQLDLVASLGWRTVNPRLRFTPDPADHETLAAKLRLAGLPPGQPWVVMHPGATAASRRYPAVRFGDAAARIASDTGCAIVFTGSAGEQPLIEQAQAQLSGRPSISLAGALTLGELAAVIAGAQVLVSNNSGPVHLAAALGTPVVDLYALTNPQHTPWQVPARVLNRDVPCRNCLKSTCPQGHHTCLLGVPADEVAQATVQLMQERQRVRALPVVEADA